MHSAKFIGTVLITIFFIASVASTEENHVREGFWGGIDAGAGYLKQSFDKRNEDDVYLFLGFKGGYTINPHFLIGLELSGWLLEASDPADPNKGKGIMQVFFYQSDVSQQRIRSLRKGRRRLCGKLEQSAGRAEQ
jgi:hypothetical protein